MSWKYIEIPNGETPLFCNAYVTSKTAMNIIVTHTPIVTTLEIQKAYRPFENYPVNVFAFDFSGTGKSGGSKKEFSRESIVKDLDSVITYIETHFSSNIHLYGNTGIGGIFAQYYVTTSNKIKSFAQFSCALYQDTARGMGGTPYLIAKVLSFLLRYLPNVKITLPPPKYQGYRHEEDNAYYEKLTEKYPDIWKTDSRLLLALTECFVATDSVIKTSVTVPTLVFKVLHDRYFSTQYFDDYYQSLTCPKKLVEINGIHNSYYIDSELFCKHVYHWFLKQ